MGDIRTYLKQFGGDSFEMRPLCDADLLVFAQLSYCDFHCVPHDLPLPEAAQIVLLAPASEDDTEQRFPFQRKDDHELLQQVIAAARYENCRFVRFKRAYDGENVQFAALELKVNGETAVIYRGTDCTLAGWKEDVDLCYRMPVKAQSLALAFLQKAAAHTAGALHICGHSKGGNLALYAALNADEIVRSHIQQVVSFDGVGLPGHVLEGFEKKPAFEPLLRRIRVILPEGSLVGVIFPQPGAVRTVDCRFVSVLQHYPYHFIIENTDFVDSSRTLFSRAASIAIDKFLAQLSLAERERFITLIYDIVRRTNAQTLQDVLRGWIKNTVPVVKGAFETLDSDSAKLYLKVILSFYRALAQTAGVLISGDEQNQA